MAHLATRESSDKGGGQGLSRKVPTTKWRVERVIWEEHIQHLLAGLEEPKLSFSCFKIRLDFQLVMRVIV